MQGAATGLGYRCFIQNALEGNLDFLGALAKLGKGDCELRHACLFVSPSACSNWTPTDGFS